MKDTNPRERIQTALNHKEADRVPVDLGGWQSGISYETYEPLKEYLGIREETRIEEPVQGLAWVDEPVLQKFRVDTRYVFPNGNAGEKVKPKGEDEFTDAWGIRWKRPASSHYYDISFSPLSEAERNEVKKYAWPVVDEFVDGEGVAGVLARLEDTQFALFTCLAGVFEQATYLRGMTRFYTDIHDDPALFEALLDGVLEAELALYGRFFEIAGERLDMVQYWGDLGSQHGPLISPDHYRRYVKPREAELVEFTRKHTNAKIALHSCGAVYDFIPDAIDAGYDVLNPVQTTAAGMDPVRLKREFGADLVFWGAVDTQRVLPFGSSEDVENEVKRQIDTLAPGGGYILAPCHNIQALTPVENVLGLFEAARSYGRY
jgi:uroporphyrinogen decarboxylase